MVVYDSPLRNSLVSVQFSTLNQDDMDWDTSMDVIKKTEEVLPPVKPTPEQLRQIRCSKKHLHGDDQKLAQQFSFLRFWCTDLGEFEIFL